MKEKTKRFFIEKKELLIFIGVVVFVFAAVIGIATLALNSRKKGETDIPVDPTPDVNDPSTNGGSTPQPNLPVVEKFTLPLTGDYKLVRTFFDETLSDEELESAVIVTGSEFITSTGTSYAKANNATFDVLAIYSGTVLSVTEDELAGTTVEIKHSNNVVSVYSSLSDVKVKAGDTVKQGAVIAKASTSINDTEAGVHVHLEVKVNGKYLNPTTIFGKEIEEVAEVK